MTRVLVRPDHGDALEEVKEHWNQHHKGGADDLIPLHLPDLRAWPDAGGYRELVGLIAGAGLREGTGSSTSSSTGTSRRPQRRSRGGSTSSRRPR